MNLTYYKCRYESGGKEEEAMKSMKKVKLYFKKLVYSELIGMIMENIGKDNWNNNVARKRYGVAFDYDNDELVDIDVVTAMIVIEASRHGHFDEFDYETKTEIVEYIVNEFKELTYKTLHEICVNYRDIDVKCDIHEFMKLREVAIKRDYSKSFSIDDMRWKIISDTELRFRSDLLMDCQRNETLQEYIEDVAFLIFPTKREAA